MDRLTEDLNREESRLKALEDSLPTCCMCDEAIHEEHYYKIDGLIYCRDCMEDEFMKKTDEYEEDDYDY